MRPCNFCIGYRNIKKADRNLFKRRATGYYGNAESKCKTAYNLTAGAFDPTDPATRNFIVKYIVQPLFKNIYSDMQKWETILENSEEIDWTIIRPSRLLNGKEKIKYRVQLDHCPKGGSKINRSDLADFIVKQINSDKYIHQKVAIAY